MSKPRIADLQRDADRAFNVGDPNVFWPEPVGSALLRLARAAKDYSDALRVGERQGDLIPPLRDALDAFDWSE